MARRLSVVFWVAYTVALEQRKSTSLRVRAAIAYALDHSNSKLLLVGEDVTGVSGNSGIGAALEKLAENYPDNGLSKAQCVYFSADDSPLKAIQKQLNLSTNPEADLELTAPRANDIGLLMYTSGTTGKPKGVLLSHKNLLCGGQNVVMAHNLTSDDTSLCILPIYHINGLCVSIMGTLLSASQLIMPAEVFGQSILGTNGSISLYMVFGSAHTFFIFTKRYQSTQVSASFCLCQIRLGTISAGNPSSIRAKVFGADY